MWLRNVIFLCFFIAFSEAFFKENILDRPEIQDSSQNHIMWHAYKFDSGIGNREELIINSIHSDNEFDAGQNVTEWQSANERNKSYAVGMMASGFTVLTSVLNANKSGFKVATKITVLKEIPKTFTLYKMWNQREKKYYIYLIVAFDMENGDLNWYRITDENNLKHILKWHLRKKVAYLKIFKTPEFTKLIIINEAIDKSLTTTADIYDFILDVDVPSIWLFQSIRLDCPAKSAAINNIASELFLSLPQFVKNIVRVFYFAENRFVPFKNITSRNVNFVSDFKIGYRSFMAIGGFGFAIYRFSSIGLIKEDIHDLNFEEVTHFLPVPVKTYRDEIILFVQHHIDYSSHVVPHIKVIIYSKGTFNAHDEIPCTAYDQFSHGSNCIVDIELETGIFGSAALLQNEMIGVIVPRFEVHSGLFILDWKLEKVTNPLLEKIELLMKQSLEVNKLVQTQQNEISEIRYHLSNSLSIDEDNEIIAPWIVTSLLAPKVVLEDLDETDIKNKHPSDLEARFQRLSDTIDSFQVKILATRSTKHSSKVYRKKYVFENLTIIGHLEILGLSKIKNLYVDQIDAENFHHIIETRARNNGNNTVIGVTTIAAAQIDNLTVTTINNIEANTLAHTLVGPITLKGDLVFENPLLVKENVEFSAEGSLNSISLKNEVVYTHSNATYENIQFQSIYITSIHGLRYINDERIKVYVEENFNDYLHIEIDTLDTSKTNILIKNLNGERFSQFIKSIHFRNLDYNFSAITTVKGKVYAHKNTEILFLNKLKYPDEYVFSKKNGFTKITGKKTFTGNISANEVVLNGLLDGVDLKTVITSSLNQSIPGNITFSNLEISESLKIDGSILVGPNFDKFVPNPTLQESNILDSNIVFSHLEIDGMLIVSNRMDGKTIENIFSDIVYKDEDFTQLSGKKEITGTVIMKDNLEILTNKINNIAINNILTVDTEQVITGNVLRGQYEIDNLELSGKYNDINAKELLGNIVRINEDVKMFGKITFEYTDDAPNIIASELHVKIVNGMSRSDFVLTTGDRDFKDFLSFNFMKTENAIFLKDLNQEIDCFDIKDYDNNRLSLTRNQNITGRYTIKHGKVKEMEIESLNTYEWDFLKDFVNITQIFYRKLLNSEFDIEELYVDGILTTKKLNGHHLDDFFKNVIWIDRKNNIQNNVEFEDNSFFKSFKIKNVNEQDFNEFVSDMIFINETNLSVSGLKIFEKGLAVMSLIETEHINDVKIKDILLKNKNQNINGQVIVHGNVWIEGNLNVNEYINGNSIADLKTTFKIDDQAYVINGDVTIPNNVFINNLYLKGTINRVNVIEHFENIINIYDDVIVNGTALFKKKVHIQKNLGVIETIDGVNMDEFMKVVLISSDFFVEGLVIFKQPLIVTDLIEVETDLDTRYISGCDIQYWISHAVFVSEGFLGGKFKFERLSASFNTNVNFLNGIDMNSLISLHTNQIINETLTIHFLTTDSDIDVTALTNGLNLKKEYENTVLINSNQEIITDTFFISPIVIKNKLNIPGLINERNISRLITTDTDQQLKASYVFTDLVRMDSALLVNGKINGINMFEWQKDTVSRTGNKLQNIKGSWTVRGNAVFQSNVTGSTLLGGINVTKLAKDILHKENEKYEIEETLKNDFRNVCSLFQSHLKESKSQIYLFKYMENHQLLNFDSDINSIYIFWYFNQQFLIVNLKRNCFSKLFVWSSNSFKKVADIYTGQVKQYITVLDSNRVYLVTKHDESKTCDQTGVNLWIFNGKTLVRLSELDRAVTLHKSNLPGSFYALNNQTVTEYRLFYEDELTLVHTSKQWDIPEPNYTFNAHDSKLGLSLRNVENILKLSHTDVVEPNYQSPMIKGSYSIVPNRYLPSEGTGEVVVFEVGTSNYSVQFTAVIRREETTILGQSDAIKIYEDITLGIIFQKIPVFRPSNLKAINFGGTNENLLIFLENYEVLQVYEYKAIQGFKYRTSARLQATQLLQLVLPLEQFQSNREFLLVVNRNNLTVIQALMDGDRSKENLHCEL